MENCPFGLTLRTTTEAEGPRAGFRSGGLEGALSGDSLGMVKRLDKECVKPPCPEGLLFLSYRMSGECTPNVSVCKYKSLLLRGNVQLLWGRKGSDIRDNRVSLCSCEHQPHQHQWK
jgi:hypothetical protein